MNILFLTQVLHVDRSFRAYAGFATPSSPSPLNCRLNHLKGALAEVGAPVFAAACARPRHVRPAVSLRRRDRARARA